MIEGVGEVREREDWNVVLWEGEVNRTTTVEYLWISLPHDADDTDDTNDDCISQLSRSCCFLSYSWKHYPCVHSGSKFVFFSCSDDRYLVCFSNFFLLGGWGGVGDHT